MNQPRMVPNQRPVNFVTKRNQFDTSSANVGRESNAHRHCPTTIVAVTMTKLEVQQQSRIHDQSRTVSAFAPWQSPIHCNLRPPIRIYCHRAIQHRLHRLPRPSYRIYQDGLKKSQRRDTERTDTRKRQVSMCRSVLLAAGDDER